MLLRAKTLSVTWLMPNKDKGMDQREYKFLNSFTIQWKAFWVEEAVQWCTSDKDNGVTDQGGFYWCSTNKA